MKIVFIIFLLILVFVLLFLVVHRSLDAAEREFDTLNHPLYTLKIPRDIYAINSPVMIYGAMESGFVSNLNIFVQNIELMTLDEFSKMMVESQKHLEGYERVSGRKRIIGGREWREEVFRFSQGSQALMSKAVWTVKNRRAIIATYTSLEVTFKKHEPGFDEIIDSIVLKKEK